MIIDGKIVPAFKDPNGNWEQFQKMFPTLANKLFLGDEVLSAVIFDDTNPHTISWHVACMEQAGNVWAILACEALKILSPNHCADAIASEGPCEC